MELLQESFGFLINQTAHLMKCRLNEKLKKYDLTTTQWAVIKEIFDQSQNTPEGTWVSPASIAEKLQLERPTITGVIERLVIRNFVTRSIHPANRRSQIIQLTEKSLEIINDLYHFSTEVNKEALQGFTEEEIIKLKGSLETIILNLIKNESE